MSDLDPRNEDLDEPGPAEPESGSSWEPMLPLVVGVSWLGLGAASGFLGFVVALVPGVLGIAAGAAGWFSPGDRRVVRMTALSGLVGLLLTIPSLFLIGFGAGLVLGLLSAASFVMAGTTALREIPIVDDAPRPVPSLALAAKVAVDDAIAGGAVVLQRRLGRGELRRIGGEMAEAHALFEGQGWLEKPAAYHARPPALERPDIAMERHRGIAFEHVTFDSDYEPGLLEPGRDRWLGYVANRRAHAYVLRHPGPDRPWLVAINGYGMGFVSSDLGAFDPREYHQRGGLNLCVPVLPLHGPRRVGRLSGQHFLSGDMLDTLHAEAQTVWDIRRLLSWIRAQSSEPVGITGISLGGYNAALMASLEPGFACAVLGVPGADLGALFFGNLSPVDRAAYEAAGITPAITRDLLRPVSPLSFAPLVAYEHRAIYAGVADRTVPAAQVQALARHWDSPRIAWYQGSHLTFAFEPEVRELITTTLRAALREPSAT